MRWTVALSLLSLVMLSLAGCSGKDKADDAPAAGTASATATTTAAPPPNQPPTGTINVVLNGTAVSFNLTGTDPDGDALRWNLTFGDGSATNGTELPALLDHTYEPGNFTAVFSLSDGNATVDLNATLTVAAAGAAGVGQVATGSWLMGSLVVGCFGDIFRPTYPDELDGIAFASFAVEPLSIGLPVSISITSAGAADSPGFTFLDAQGGVIVSAFLSTPPETVPEGAATGIFWVCAGGPMEGTYTSG